MVPEMSEADSVATEGDQLRTALFEPLTTITTRTELLQRITMVTPGLTDLERTALLEGLGATLGAARQLSERLEAFMRREAGPGAPGGDGPGEG